MLNIFKGKYPSILQKDDGREVAMYIWPLILSLMTSYIYFLDQCYMVACGYCGLDCYNSKKYSQKYSTEDEWILFERSDD